MLLKVQKEWLPRAELYICTQLQVDPQNAIGKDRFSVLVDSHVMINQSTLKCTLLSKPFGNFGSGLAFSFFCLQQKVHHHSCWKKGGKTTIK